ncbi:hypothetical protein J4412_00165 [Candidatus Pacearchaeota archaeon]|nr:MAG: hypothetical protein QJ16_C0005G0173 [archaeon GW2011_AR1]MBS3077911.1 hypothetical protein [Candidatus Pacearchaeota archaeon]HIH52311.1 hypothetical protein [Nanoarchaeota archaeon]
MGKIGCIYSNSGNFVYFGCTNCDSSLNYFLKEKIKYRKNSKNLDLILEREKLECPNCFDWLHFGNSWFRNKSKYNLSLKEVLK